MDTEDTTPERVCVAGTCGNGRLDENERCDDGNNRSRDGCPADCSKPCGDGARDPDEMCDDGNAIDGDGCSSDCMSIDGIFSVSPPTVMFSATEGDDPPPPVRVAVRLEFRGDRALPGYVDGAPQPSWLSIESEPATATTADFKLRVLDTLSVGLRSTTVRLTISHETSTDLDTFDLPVAFNVIRSDLAIEAMPATLAFMANADDPVAPSSTVTVLSNGPEITVVSAPSWVTVTPGPATEPASFTVSANSTSFPDGTNLSGDIVFRTARGAVERRTSVHATYSITGPPTLAIDVTPATLTFRAEAGQALPAAQAAHVTFTGTAVTVVSAPSWLTISLSAPAPSPALVGVSVNTTAFDPGTLLEGDIVFRTTRGAAQRDAAVHVEYVIVAPPRTIRVPIDRPTIQAAINAAIDRDTIIVADGTYTENIDFKGKAITLRSANGPATTIIDGGDRNCVVKFVTGEASAALLMGFTIRRGRASTACGIEGAGIFVDHASPTIDGNIITDNRGCQGLGIGVAFGSPIIQNNLITQNQRENCTGGFGGGGISVRGASFVQIIGNTITNNDPGDGGGGGISLFAAGPAIIRGNIISGNIVTTEGGAILMLTNSPAVITNNIITQNSASLGGGIFAAVPSDSTGPRIVNNTIARNTATDQGSELYLDGFLSQTQIWNNVLFGTSARATVVCDTTSSTIPPLLRFNDGFNTTGPAYAGSCANVTGTDGNISVDPLFVSASDFHLDVTSPAIDAGSNTAPSLPSTDFAGNPRVFDGNGDSTATADMGAFELTGAP